MRELELIARIRDRARAGEGVRIGIGDDCAVLQVPRGCELVVTTDLLLEGRHFRRDWHSAESAGHRCLARGLSDIAAMGARPLAAFLSLALPAGFDKRWVDGFLDGMLGLAARFGVTLAGGDTAQAAGAEMVADIVLTGTVPRGRALLRSGARVGDGVYVTGRLGGSAAELEAMEAMAAMPSGSRGTLRGKLRGRRGPQSFPEPRIAVGQALRRYATACMDLSDGISTDLAHLCRASGVGAELTGVPVAEGATLAQALDGGEDYELLFTAAEKVPQRIAGVEVTRVGEVVAGREVRLNGKLLERGGWEHFSGAP